MQFSTILTSFALATACVFSTGNAAGVPSRETAKVDETILEMSDAFKRGDRRRLTLLLPQVRGHALEPWGAYWEIRARLEEASAQDIQSFLYRYSGTYQEDRLRNDWLLLLGQRREWGTFMAEYPKFRMNDDRSVRCYALLTEYNAGDLDVAGQVEEFWLAQRDVEEGCAAAADQQLKAGKLKPHTAWLRARLGMENDRLRIATQAIGLLNPEWAITAGSIYANPERYLNEKIT
ncbi:MAG TPA: lytic transglycosylase domain-containing protein, partial [Burkholderiaceae bacterium]|nr:lytic transglycosylase domain-containing protein [Burkholderiaceae bacterium]